MGPGGFDMQQIFAAAQQALSAQQELANSELTGTAGGGAVRAVVSGVGQLLDVTIDPSVIDPADPAETAATIADLVLAAVRDAWDSAVDLQQQQLGALGGLGGSAAGWVVPRPDSTCPALACLASAASRALGTARTRTRTRTAKTTRTFDDDEKTKKKTARTDPAHVRRRHPASH